jgi:hypothetical protein
MALVAPLSIDFLAHLGFVQGDAGKYPSIGPQANVPSLAPHAEYPGVPARHVLHALTSKGVETVGMLKLYFASAIERGGFLKFIKRDAIMRA